MYKEEKTNSESQTCTSGSDIEHFIYNTRQNVLISSETSKLTD